MAATLDHPHFRVFDDFLDEDAWTRVWTHFQFVDLLPVSRSVGAWKLDDGVPLGGHEQLWTKAGPAHGPEQASPFDLVARAVLDQPETHAGLVAEGWDRISARPYVYPRGTALSWHVDDSELYAGAFIYYAHPRWNAHWGGELLLAALDEDPEDESAGEGDLPIMAYRFETDAYSDRLLELGAGSFVMPKPNRLVVLAGAPHMIARISPAAGHNVRASISGFFLEPGPKDG